jgi:class 3 adenylate cyclase
MVDLETLTLTEAIRLQAKLSTFIEKKFQRHATLVFSDIVGSTPYFARFGNEAGRSLQQRHIDQLQGVLADRGGRIVDTAGDGAFLCFDEVEPACTAMTEMNQRISADNFKRPREHQMALRIGIHWGSVLTDSVVVTGDAVNLSSRVASSARPGEIRITRPVFFELPSALRMQCKPLEPVKLEGIDQKVALMELIWWDPSRFPEYVCIENSGEKLPLPALDTISFGRIAELDGAKANDIVIKLAEEQLSNMVSRWHFELRRRPEGFVLRSVSSQLTEVDGRTLKKGEEADVRAGTSVVLAKTIVLKFLSQHKDVPDPQHTAVIV